MSEEIKIDFIGIGAEKSGTTWLADMLKQHPQIFFPVNKELHYFNRKFVEDPSVDNLNYDKPLSWYLDFFKGAKASQIKGEITPTYLWDANAPERIKQVFSTVKLIAILRDPAERAFSQYTYYQQKGIISEKLSFSEAIEKFPYLIERSAYGQQLRKYFDLFPHEQIKVLFFEDIRKDNKAFLLSVEQFLGIKPFIPASLDDKSNITGDAKYPLLNKLLFRSRLFLRKNNFRLIIELMRITGIAKALEKFRNDSKRPDSVKRSLDASDRQMVTKLLRQDIELLEKLLDTDLYRWKA
jgi:hypothetical protein